MNDDDLKSVQMLARLDLTDDESIWFREALEQIVHYFSVMADSDLPPTTHAVQSDNRLRPDRERESPHPDDDLLSQAPEFDQGFFVIPNVL